ncbi:MAG: hypothetical protein JSW58_08310 [Candidatus Latescibacterota bacterium]|nr:MAG: hypothetical protein JSW58_08310 [Candidatus Latescibacterota bacterium]
MAQRELVPILVKIGLTQTGRAEYPPFNQLPVVAASGLDWSRYVDIHGTGWKYDKTSGHQDDTPGSPLGMQWGALLVPEQFAIEAAQQFPTVVTILNENDYESFHDSKATIYDPDELVDAEVLAGIQAKVNLANSLAASQPSLNLDLTQGQIEALDPDDDKPGIRKNKMKKWSDAKAARDIKIKDLT